MKSQYPEVRAEAAKALGGYRGSAAKVVPVLIEAVKSPGFDNRGVRAGAIASLGQLGPSAREAVPALITAAGGDDLPGVAVVALGQIGSPAKDAIQVLAAVAKDPKNPASPAAAKSLLQIDPVNADAIAVFAARLQEKLPDKKDTSATFPLLDLGPAAKGMVPSLVTMVRGNDAEHRRHAFEILGRIGPDAKGARDAVAQRLNEPDKLDRLEAARTLQEIDPGNEAARAACAGLLKDDNKTVQIVAAGTLLMIDPRNSDAKAILLPLLGYKDREGYPGRVPNELCRAGASAIPELVARLDHADPAVRQDAAITLMLIGNRAKENLPALVTALKNKDSTVRYAAATGLATFVPGGKSAAPALVAALDDKQMGDRAMFALEQMGDAALPELKAALADPGKQKQLFAAVTILRSRDDKEAKDMLIAFLGDKDSVLSTQASFFLMSLGPIVADLSPKLLEIARDRKADDMTRGAAMMALRTVDFEAYKKAGFK
jgi:HEAT repeat protein